MQTLTKSRIEQILSELNAAPLRRRGQNFLIDPGSLEAIARAVLAMPCDVLIEIGPGLGSLTRLLLSEKPVHAIELDPLFVTFLRKDLPELFLLEGDAVKILEDLARSPAFSGSAIAGPRAGNLKAALCGNLPYSVTTDLLRGAVRVPWIDRAVFLTQLEFAERICSPGAESSFAVYLGSFGQFRKIRKVGRNAFYPAPSVDSALIEFERTLPACDPDALEKILRASFHARRKKLLNSWKLWHEAGGLDAGVLLTLAESAGIDTSRRAEELERSDYYTLARLLTART